MNLRRNNSRAMSLPGCWFYLITVIFLFLSGFGQIEFFTRVDYFFGSLSSGTCHGVFIIQSLLSCLQKTVDNHPITAYKFSEVVP